jgi:hypothetical protein
VEFLAACIVVGVFAVWAVNAVMTPILQAGSRARADASAHHNFMRWREQFWRAHGRLPEERDWNAHQEWERHVRAIERENGGEWTGIEDPTLKAGYR